MAMNFKKKPIQTKEPKQKKEKKKMTKRQIVNTVCICFLSLVLIGSVAAFVVVQSVLSSSNIVEGIEGLESAHSSEVYDADGELITTLSTLDGVRENISYEEVPQVVIDAFLATEDSRFYKHNGFDFPRFMKAGLENVKAGGISQGGSTLTMQLVDVQLYTAEQKATFGVKEKIEQKIVEIFKSMEIESKLDKNKILENYMNAVNFGGPARGIQKGAQYYFGKDAKDLTLSEAAFLAGVVNAPGSYNPYNGKETLADGSEIDHYELAVKRRNNVLYLMNYHGYISDEEYQMAQATDLASQLNGVMNFETERNKAYIDSAVAEVKEKTGKNPYETPMRIYTNMNSEAQALADSLCDGEGINFPDELFQTGFVAMDNQTGAIVAIGGGRSYTGGANQRNRAMIDKHQIGSTSKPIVDYAQAFEYLGYSTEHVFEDGPVPYGEGGSVMQNFSRQFQGDVTFKTALGTSLNVPAYTTLLDVIEEIGIEKEVELLNDMGIDFEEDEFTYGISIGGSDLDASPVQMAGAYSVFANKGNYIEPFIVKKVEYLEGDEEDYKAKPEKQRVFSEETAYLMSYMLKDAVDNQSYGTLVNTLRSSFPVYGKSGTSDFGDEAAQYGIPVGAAKDKWMVGYTSQYTVACWAGYDQPIAGQNTYLDEAKIWANIEGTVVRELLNKLSEGQSVNEIARPSGVVSISHIQGLFPYATASNTNGDLMVTGLINKKFAGNLKTVTPDALDNLSSLQATFDNNTVTIKFADYPNPEKLKEASGTKTMTANGVSAVGKCIFDKSFLFGAVEYKYEIKVNGAVVDSGSSSSSTITKQINAKNGDKIEVVGWYGYSKTDVTSNKVSKSLTAENLETKYTIGSDFTALFASGDAGTLSRVKNFVETFYKGVTIEVLEDPDTPLGEFSSLSTCKEGDTISSKNSYIIYVGSKKN